MVNILLSEYNFDEPWANGVRKYVKPGKKVVVIPFAFSKKKVCNVVAWDNLYDKVKGKYYRCDTL